MFLFISLAYLLAELVIGNKVYSFLLVKKFPFACLRPNMFKTHIVLKFHKNSCS